MSSFAQDVEARADGRLVKAFGRVPARPFECIACDVLDDKLVVGDVEVEGADHVVAIAECVGDLVIEFMPGRLGVTHEVEPVPAPALAVMRAGQKAIDQLLVGVWGIVVQKNLDVIGPGGKPGQVECEAANQGALAGFRRGIQILLFECG